MRSAAASKKRYLVLMIIALAAFLVWRVMNLSPLDQKIIKQVKVNDTATLYITEASAGTTTGFSYRYYLHKNDSDFSKKVSDETPFMITADHNATVTVKEGQVYFQVRGEIYSFRNTSYLAKIHLDASPY